MAASYLSTFQRGLWFPDLHNVAWWRPGSVARGSRQLHVHHGTTVALRWNFACPCALRSVVMCCATRHERAR